MDVKCSKRAVRARTILNDHRLAECGTEFIGDDPAERIAGAAGAENGNHCDRARRIVVGVKRSAKTGGCRGAESEKQFSHVVFPPRCDRRAGFFMRCAAVLRKSQSNRLSWILGRHHAAVPLVSWRGCRV